MLYRYCFKFISIRKDPAIEEPNAFLHFTLFSWHVSQGVFDEIEDSKLAKAVAHNLATKTHTQMVDIEKELILNLIRTFKHDPGSAFTQWGRTAKYLELSKHEYTLPWTLQIHILDLNVLAEVFFTEEELAASKLSPLYIISVSNIISKATIINLNRHLLILMDKIVRALSNFKISKAEGIEVGRLLDVFLSRFGSYSKRTDFSPNHETLNKAVELNAVLRHPRVPACNNMNRIKLMHAIMRHIKEHGENIKYVLKK